ncbi:MAG: citryl-CoA lyase [Nitrospirae bacterium]|nr:citryl-CoA lyase [Nitrospirota bacterium]
MSDVLWKTSVAGQIDGKTVIRGYPLYDLIGNITFPEAIYLALKGELPSQPEARMMNAMLTACIDHGIAPPSVVAARTVFSGGNSLNSAVAAGALTLGDFHGGAIEQCMKLFEDLVGDSTSDVTRLAKDQVAAMRAAKLRFPGFGHKLYKRDPRTVRMLELAKEYGFGGRYIDFAVAVQNALEESMGRDMPLNVDGAIAAILCDMGFDWKVGKGFFIIARIPGVVAHIVEEWSREKPFRRLPEGSYEYDGPALRAVPGTVVSDVASS